MPQIINSKARIFNHSEHGKRIIFIDGPTNPRDKLGKIGIDLHDGFTRLFRDAVAAEVTIIDDAGNESVQTVYLNCKSIIKYLLAIPHFHLFYTTHDASAKAFYNSRVAADANYTLADFFTDYVISSHKALVSAIDIAMLAVKDNEASHKWQQIYHAGTVSDTRSLKQTTATDNTTGKFYSWQYQQTIGSLASIKTRFAFVNKEKDLKFVSESMARLRFREASADTPAYRAFLTTQGQTIKQFSDIPATSKKSYIAPIQAKNRDFATHKKGKYPKKFKLDTSTGTTGKPTTWVRGHDEILTVKKSFNTAREVEFGNRELFYINAFALGPWATGLTAYESMRETGSTFSCGPDLDKILDTLETIYQAEVAEMTAAIDKFIVPFDAEEDEDLTKHKATLLKITLSILNELLDNKDANIDHVVNTHLAGLDDLPQKFFDLKSFIALIKELNKNKKQYILAGYPPFLKTVADTANTRKIDFAKYHLRGVVGGKGFQPLFVKH